MRLPPEAGYSPEMVGEVDKCLFGIRDVAQVWDGAYAEAMQSLGFRKADQDLAFSTIQSRTVSALCTEMPFGLFAKF